MKNIFLSLLALFVLELIVLIQVGSALGALTTISLMFVSMVIGACLVKMRFAQVVKQIREEQRFDPSLIWIPLAGFLFIFPGFISDIIALLLLIPSVRKPLGNYYSKTHMGDGFTKSSSSFTYSESYYKEGRTIDGTAQEETSKSDNEQLK